MARSQMNECVQITANVIKLTNEVHEPIHDGMICGAPRSCSVTLRPDAAALILTKDRANSGDRSP